MSTIQSPRHVLGLDLGTSNLRIHVAHYDPQGKLSGEPALVHLPGAEKDGALPTVLELDEQGNLLTYGRPAVLNMPRGNGHQFVFEFKPCIGQAEEDLHAQGRPDKAKYCSNADCLHPGWAWSVAMRFCGFCGSPLGEASTERGWEPSFRYNQQQALDYSSALLLQISQRLEAQFNDPLSAEAGWMIAAGVPVHWQTETRAKYQEMLRQAFPTANTELMHEPAGALRYYAKQGMLEEREDWTLIVDFGAGTTDLILAKVVVAEGQLALKDSRSYGERYGGGDFDLLLAHHAAGELGVELDGGVLAQWKLQARELKETFSAQMHQNPTGEVTLPFPVPKSGGLFEYAAVTIDRRTFERVAGDLVERFRSVLERGMKHLTASASEVTQVVLTGGGAHWYFVEESVREFFPQARALSGVEPERSISRGLALSSVSIDRLAPTPIAEKPILQETSLSDDAVEPPVVVVKESKPAPAPEAKAGEERVNPTDSAVMVYVPSGEFIMGSDHNGDDEKPQSRVYLHGYWIYKHPVTVAQYMEFCTVTRREKREQPKWGWQDNHPIVNVTWHDAVAYCEWAGAKLPTEAQWEKAARGTAGRIYPWGNEWDEKKCHCYKVIRTETQVEKTWWGGERKKDMSVYTDRTAPVGSYPQGASPYGCLDMAGNVWEWCADWYDANYYRNGPRQNPSGPDSGSGRVLRGGSWCDDSLYCRCSYRSRDHPVTSDDIYGFRCAVLR